MAADVSSLVRVLGGSDQHRTVVNESNSETSTALITRDLLGGSSNFVESQELDLDLQAPPGWEKRLDLKSGKVYLQKWNSSTSENKFQTNSAGPKLQDLNFPPSSSNKQPLNLYEETSLDLKLMSSTLPSIINCQSVCTLDKVKSALERAEKEPSSSKKRTSFWKSSSSFSSQSPSYSSSSSSIRDTQEDQESEEKLQASPMAAGCPGCLSYVLIMKNNPKCPRCNSVVPLPLMKKPKIDLNISI